MMSDSNLALQKKQECFLKSLSGDLQGTVFKMTSSEIYIGRDPSNHISIPTDKRLSRRHARFIFHKGKIYVQNLSAKNFVKVNNERVKQMELKNGYIVSVGEQTFKFITSEGLGVAPATDSSQQAKRAPFKTKNNQKNKLAPVVFTLVLVAGAYLYLKPPAVVEAKKMREIATTEKIYEQVRANSDELDKLELELKESEKETKEYRQSQAFYLKGFRDFQKGLYSASLSSFETSLSLYPKHPLSRRYLEISKNRAEELTAYNLNAGRVHLENGKYDFCVASLRNAILQMYDKSDARYEEAKTLIEKCKLLKRSKY